MKIKLFTRDNGLVADAEIPPFNEPPDVLLWGERIFKFRDDYFIVGEPRLLIYVETFVYAVPIGVA